MTVAESTGTSKDDHTKVIIDDYVNGPRRFNSDAVLEARLRANGLRGQDLTATVRLARMERREKYPPLKEPANVLVLARGGKSSTFRFATRDAANVACRMLRKMPEVIFANVVRNYDKPLPQDDPFANELLKLL